MITQKVNADEIEDRLDAYYYSPIFRKVNKLRNIKTIKFGNLIEIITKGETPLWRGDAYLSSGIPFLKVRNISEEGIEGDLTYISDKVHNRMKRSQLNGGELLFTMAGRIGTALILPENFGEANINQAIAKIILKRGVNKEYVKCILNSDVCFLQTRRLLTSSAQPNINFEQIKNIRIPLLPSEVQSEITKIIHNAYLQKEKKLKQADELLDSIDDFVRQQLGIEYEEPKEERIYIVNSQDIENNRHDPYYHNPKFATTINQLLSSKYPIIELGNFITEIRYGASVKNDYVDDGIPLLRILNLKPNNIDLNDVVRLPKNKSKEIGNCYVFESDLLISRSGSIGIVAVVPKEADGFAYGSFMIKFRVDEQLDNNYVSIWLNSEISKLLVQRERIGAIQGNITIPAIQSFLLPLPPVEKQKDIARKVNEKYQEVEKLKSEGDELIKQAKKKVEEIIFNS